MCRLEKLEEMQLGTVRQKDASETEGTSIHMGHKTWATTKKQEKRIAINEMRAMMDVRTAMQRQDQERTYPRNNESDARCQTYHGATIELVEER